MYAYRSDPSALIEFSSDFQVVGEIPIPLPLYCGLQNIFPSPAGRLFAIELSCPEGQKVLFLNVETHALTQPIVDADSHFLAWASEGKTAYLRADSLGDPYIVRVSANGVQGAVLIHGFTYDLASSPDDGKFVFTFSRGLGQGSELWLATHDANVVKPLYSDRYNYISFARFSPDGSQIAFIKIPDTQTPFTVGELWVIGADGSNPHKLADADAGHGYAANWSPDGKRIAFVARENPEDEKADQSSVALISNIYTVDVGSRALTQVTDLTNDYVETPFWSPLGNTLTFTVVINDRMEVHIADLTTEAIRSLGTESTCCPAWLRK
ncbi:MAG TPA: hypothetical protein VHP14_13020 [Anaerolineales bacterium]|nr:hypothetical protein [Anaerolineales bacterium]